MFIYTTEDIVGVILVVFLILAVVYSYISYYAKEFYSKVRRKK